MAEKSWELENKKSGSKWTRKRIIWVTIRKSEKLQSYGAWHEWAGLFKGPVVARLGHLTDFQHPLA